MRSEETDEQTKKGFLHCVRSLLQWCHPDLNRGHTDFQSDALPTELWHPACCECKGGHPAD